LKNQIIIFNNHFDQSGEVELLTQRVPVEKLLRVLRETGRSASLQGLGGGTHLWRVSR
jgi:hypothetical protein